MKKDSLDDAEIGYEAAFVELITQVSLTSYKEGVEDAVGLLRQESGFLVLADRIEDELLQD